MFGIHIFTPDGGGEASTRENACMFVILRHINIDRVCIAVRGYGRSWKHRKPVKSIAFSRYLCT